MPVFVAATGIRTVCMRNEIAGLRQRKTNPARIELGPSVRSLVGDERPPHTSDAETVCPELESLERVAGDDDGGHALIVRGADLQGSGCDALAFRDPVE